MCGIAGCAAWGRDLSQGCPNLNDMVEALSHRGPDASGTWLSEHVAFGHRRLAVIDPEGGAQPMLYRHSGRTLTVVYNGEIYNFRELRDELQGRGHRFQSHSDTEVLLAAYAEWDLDCLQRLNGIFAFALWDDHKQRLLLARDRLGVKPLYYIEREGLALFASEIKALLANPLVSPVVSHDGLAEVFSPVPLRTPGFTIYRDIREVGAGCFVTFNKEGTRTAKYWSLRIVPHPDDLQTTVDRVRSLLEDTVRRQLIADVPVVTLLSGGIDSSGITALAAKELRERGETLNTYAVDFASSVESFRGSAESSTDSFWANHVSESLGTQHHSVAIKAEQLLDNLTVPTLARDAPGLGQLDTSLYLLCKRIKENATVALSGETADEIFAGYHWYHSPEVLKTAGFPWVITMGAAASGPQSSFWLSPQLQEKIQPHAYVQRRYEEALAEVPRAAGEDACVTKRREIFYLTVTQWLQTLLDRKDRMSMAAGLEVRVPFADHRLVEYLWNVPWDMQTVDGQEKSLLRRAWAGLVPEAVRQRKKSAYPVSEDASYASGVRRLALDVFENSNAPVLPFLNLPVVKAIAAGRIPAMTPRFATPLLERIIQLDVWLRHYHVSVQ